jgi:hypothetical protein
MATVTAPLSSQSAWGQLAKELIFYRGKGKHYCKSYAAPSNPKSHPQIGIRRMNSFLMSRYNLLTAEEKASWDNLALEMNVPPRIAFYTFNMKRWAGNCVPRRDTIQRTMIIENEWTLSVIRQDETLLHVEYEDCAMNNMWGIAICIGGNELTTDDRRKCIAVRPAYEWSEGVWGICEDIVVPWGEETKAFARAFNGTNRESYMLANIF